MSVCRAFPGLSSRRNEIINVGTRRGALTPMTVHLPARAGERNVVASAPGDHRGVGISQSSVVAPMRRRRYAAARRREVNHAANRGERRGDTDAELDFELPWFAFDITIDEGVLPIELRNASAAGCVNLIEIGTKLRRNARSWNASADRGNARRRRLLKSDRIVSSDPHLASSLRSNTRRAVNTSGIVTNGMCAKICTHQRKPSRGGRPVAIGMTARDITSQITGP